MCEVCYSNPCLARCPNAPEPKAVYICVSCGESIEEGEEFFKLDDGYYHDDCFREDAVQILCDDYGAVKGIAEVEASC